MRSPVPLLAFALGLLPSFTIAKCGDNVAIERLPVFSDSDGPFIIRAQEGFNVFLQYEKEYKDYNFVLSKKDSDLPEFELKDGNLTSADGNLAGIYGKVPQIYPPPLLGLYLIDHVGDYPGAEVVFVTKTRSDGSGREVRRLFFLDGPPVVKKLEEGAKIYIKPDGNVVPTTQLQLDVRRPVKSKAINQEDCAGNQKYFKNWDLK